MKRSLQTTLLLVALAGSLFPQTGDPNTTPVPDSTVLTNAHIIEMKTVGISTTIILAKIRASQVQFRTDTEGLKNLTDAGVPDEIIAAMIEGSRNMPLPIKPTPLRASPSFIPYQQLDKNARKQRLKSPAQISIAASADTVSSLLVRAFQSIGYIVQNESRSSLFLVREVKSTGASILAGMMGHDRVQHEIRLSISEVDGISSVTLSLWLSMENRFGKKTSDNRDGKDKDRIGMEEILMAVKRRAETRD